jgi:hypothetical protein
MGEGRKTDVRSFSRPASKSCGGAWLFGAAYGADRRTVRVALLLRPA